MVRYVRSSYTYGLIFGLLSCVITSLIALLPFENLIHERPSYIQLPDLCLYLWRLSVLTLCLVILTAVVIYISGRARFLTGVLDGQCVVFLISHYLYLHQIAMLPHVQLSISFLLYVINGVAHLDLGQIMLIYLIARITYELIRRLKMTK